MLRVLVLAIRGHVVGRAVHQKRIRAAGEILGHIDCREKPLAVAHRNAELVFRVVGANGVFTRRIRHWLLGGRSGKSKHKEAE